MASNRRRRWVEPLPGAYDATSSASAPLIAVIGAWMEGDVIEATVRNAFAQGCDRVLLVDNDSPDDTVEVAVAAGAELAVRWSSATFDEPERIRLMAASAARAAEASGADHMWWLFLDADHFPHGPDGITVRQYLGQIDGRCRVVGARFLNHFPTSPPHNVPGRHPLDFQPLCDIADRTNCSQPAHWQHPLLRWDAGGRSVTPGVSFHTARCEVTLYEPDVPIWIHHFQYREEATTRRRLATLCSPTAGPARNAQNDERFRALGTPGLEVSGMTKRFVALDDVYGHRWDRVPNFHDLSRPQIGVEPVHWLEAIGADADVVPRWYAADSVSSSWT